MCTIWVKEAGTEMPDNWKTIVKRLARKNRDGNGLMWSGNYNSSVVHAHKGLMNETKLVDAIEAIEDVTNKHLAIHCRISTHGKKDETMTHPFPVARNLEQTKMIDYTSKAAIAHNGILSDFGDVLSDDCSDSAHFANFLSYLNLDELLKDESELMLYVAEIVGHSKVILIYKGTLFYFGPWVKDEDYPGSAFSNRDYIETTYAPPSNATGGVASWEYRNKRYENAYGRYAGGYYGDEWDGTSLFDADDEKDEKEDNEALVKANATKFEVVCDSTAMCDNWSCQHKIPHEINKAKGCMDKRDCKIGTKDEALLFGAECHTIERHMGTFRVGTSDMLYPCVSCGEYCDDDEFWEFTVTYREENTIPEGKMKGSKYTIYKTVELYVCAYCNSTHVRLDKKDWSEMFEAHYSGKETVNVKSNI
jgi:hypothetical protein